MPGLPPPRHIPTLPTDHPAAQPRMTLEGRFDPFTFWHSNGRNRRYLAVAARSGEGPFTYLCGPRRPSHCREVTRRATRATRRTGPEPLSLSGRVNEPASRTANARRRPALHRRLGLGRCGGSAARRGGPARDEARQRCTARGNGSASRPCTARRTTLMFLSSPACLHGLRARPVRGAPPTLPRASWR